MNHSKHIFYPLLFLGSVLSLWVAAARMIYSFDRPYINSIRLAARETFGRPLLLGALILGALIGVLLIYVVERKIGNKFSGARYHRFLRGTRIVSEGSLSSTTKERGDQVAIGNVPMPLKVENRNLLVAGSVGTGKSVCIKGMINSIMRRHDRMVVIDPDGDYLSKFYLPGDKILNPFDERGEGWSIFNELFEAYDYDEYAKSIIPESKSSDGEEWAAYSRVLFAETARALFQRGKANTEELVDWLTRIPFSELKPMLSHTAASPIFADDAERARGSIRFTLSKFLSPHQYLRPGTFSLRRWLNDPAGGNLYITWRAGMLESLKPLISTWTDVLCKAILATPENENNRIWFFIDELAALQMLPSLPAAATIGRKHGLRIVAGLQSVSQLKKIYGDAGSVELRSCFRSQLVFGGATTDPDTAEQMSLGLGEHEVERIKHAPSQGPSGYSSSRSTDIVRERVVLPSEITSLPDLTGYVKFAGDYPVARIKFTPRSYVQRTEMFVEE